MICRHLLNSILLKTVYLTVLFQKVNPFQNEMKPGHIQILRMCPGSRTYSKMLSDPESR